MPAPPLRGVAGHVGGHRGTVARAVGMAPVRMGAHGRYMAAAGSTGTDAPGWPLRAVDGRLATAAGRLALAAGRGSDRARRHVDAGRTRCSRADVGSHRAERSCRGVVRNDCVVGRACRSRCRTFASGSGRADDDDGTVFASNRDADSYGSSSLPVRTVTGKQTGRWPMVDNAYRRNQGGYSWETEQGAYERGMTAAIVKQREEKLEMAREFADTVRSLLQPTNVPPAPITLDHKRSTPGTWPRFMRAAEHIVTDLDPATAATPHGIVTLGTSVATPLTATWMDDALRATRYATLIEQSEPGMPTLPKMATVPTAGPQGGEKTDVYSRMFDITNDDAAAVVDSTLHLNISKLVDISPGTMGILQAIMRSAVAAEASAQVCAAITAAGTTGADLAGGFGAFDGSRFTPSVVVTPPSQLFAVDATTLAAAGIAVVVDPAATSVLVVDPAAVVGWFIRMAAQAAESSVQGYGVAFGIYGKVSVDTTGVAVVTAGP